MSEARSLSAEGTSACYGPTAMDVLGAVFFAVVGFALGLFGSMDSRDPSPRRPRLLRAERSHPETAS